MGLKLVLSNASGVPIYEQITSFREWMIIMERPLPEIEKILGEPVAVVH